ncbi:ribosomal large subunit pseudouridine synthase C [Methyloglobulus morosus KoM1]|uniref:Pseudouridine synthase n=1 Tax=Methyloglobulus morosus KoM1 TaxID=1116472 RepID=V5B9L6_9GAMM|nr:23S rRNA pseudouridine(955/2504/2580) synthase RluC [Methyloglobulus morosus]ESS69970.1 ribosomal large subunit pseudouridine synthase C [Methyloglobulus morosus KoM1]
MDTEQQSPPPQVQWVEITEDNSEQRLDNFLITRLKGVPKSRIYRIVRKGEVRVNKGRVDVKYRLVIGDIVRIPPVRMAESGADDHLPVSRGLTEILQHNVLFEDDAILIVNKPSGFAVHGGSGVDSGIIEGFRKLNPEQHFLELVHRLDRDTSGCLLIAKKRSALRALHEQFRDDTVSKTYLALLSGQWARKKLIVNQPLLKNVSKGGERMVIINQAGKASETLFRRIKLYKDATLVEVSPKTGRTHQIRVHAAFLSHPIIGDDRYGLDDINKAFKNRGYKRMFLHAETLQFQHPVSGETLKISAPLPQHFIDFTQNEEQI